MDELQLLSRQEPGQISIDNFPELKSVLTAMLSRYQGMVYTESMLPAAKADKTELFRLRTEIDNRRKEIKRAYLAPYNDFEAQVKELLAMVDAPLSEVKTFLSEMEAREKEAKRQEIETYFFQNCAALGALAGQVLNSPAFFDSKWLNKSTAAKTWKTAVDSKITAAARDLQSIQAAAGPHAGAMTAKYLETLTTDGLAAYRSQLAAVAAVEPGAPAAPVSADRRQGTMTLRLTGSGEELAQAMEVLTMLGMDCEILDDDRPQPMPERTAPDFDSFVCFDLETSGTYGAANGDAPAEITEIGAVRVVNGEITETFSQLVNPGRKILPRISRITGITDAMVSDQPDVETALRSFADFVGDSILIGHNIKSSDLYYIDRAAKRAGIRLENPFFDTYRFARTLKEAQGWENVKLEYLSEALGIDQPAAHRAWCDAQANAVLYGKLKALAQ
jgi:DNA polymerase III epsilon subunit family exonuclease